LYVKGFGVSQDYIEAYAWFCLAYEEGNQNAKEFKKVEKKLTKAQLGKALGKVKDYRKSFEL